MQLPAAVINDTVAAVFSDPAYNRTSFLERVLSWFWELVRTLFSQVEPVGSAPTWLSRVLVALAGAILVLLLSRWIYALYLARPERRDRRFLRSAGFDTDVDFWQLAQDLAGRGDHTAAAHALYAVVLGVLDQREEVVLHESKTIGDYLRELHADSPTQRALFREFARHYEQVIYGIGTCDRASYERLRGLALAITEDGRARAGAA